MLTVRCYCHPQASRRTSITGQINTAVFLVVETKHITTLLTKNRRNTADRATNCKFFDVMGGSVSPTCVFRQAISTGLVNCCAMCKGRPRRTGERVCGRTCRERERQAAQVQGSYYGVPITRRECRIRPGESSQQPQPSGPSGHRESDAKGHMPFPESGPDSSFHQGDPIKSPAPYPSLVETATKVSPIFRDASSSPSPHGRTRHTRVIPRTPTVGPDQHHPEQQDPDGWGSYSSPHSGSQHYPGGFHNVTPSTSHLPLPRPPEYGRPLPLEGQDPHNDLFSRRYGPPQPLTYQARARGSESGGNFGSQSPDYPLGFESGGNRWVA
jgi:hypothetical protein